MENLIIIIIVGVAVFYMARVILKSVRKDASSSCGCGSSACNADKEDPVFDKNRGI